MKSCGAGCGPTLRGGSVTVRFRGWGWQQIRQAPPGGIETRHTTEVLHGLRVWHKTC